jgi:hypothetical protein
MRRMVRGAAVAVAVIVGALAVRDVGSQAAGPPAVYSVGAAFDAGRSRLVVFGGYARGGYVGDTWEWDGTAWTRFTGPGPRARNSPALVYDAARRQIVLFGGDARPTGSLGDTWTFDGATWREAATTGPPPRTTHHMVYDAARRRVVLFGGADGNTMLGDTWEWDGTRWTPQTASGPAPRTLYGLAYDAARQRTVLFGGTSVLESGAPSHGDTWEYDGRAWRRLDVVGPSPRDHVAMDYDAERRVVVLHGGGAGDPDKHETWTFDGRAWTRAADTGPPRRYARLSFDPRTKSMLLYGGFDREPSNELWRFTSGAWNILR